MTLTSFVGSGSVRDHKIILTWGQTHLKYTLSLRRSKVTTHTTPRPDTILEGQRNNGAFRQRSVTVNKGGLEAPEGPGNTELSQIFHSTQEAWADAATDEISATRRFGNTQRRSMTLSLSKKNRMHLGLSAELRRLMTKDIWQGQQITCRITVGPSREFVTKWQPRIRHALAGKTAFAWTVPNNTNDFSDFFCPG